MKWLVRDEASCTIFSEFFWLFCGTWELPRVCFRPIYWWRGYCILWLHCRFVFRRK